MNVCKPVIDAFFGLVIQFTVPTGAPTIVYYGAHDGNQIKTIYVYCKGEGGLTQDYVSRLRPKELAGFRSSLPGGTCAAFAKNYRKEKININVVLCEGKQ